MKKRYFGECIKNMYFLKYVGYIIYQQSLQICNLFIQTTRQIGPYFAI
jgi:hypothetical protein